MKIGLINEPTNPITINFGENKMISSQTTLLCDAELAEMEEDLKTLKPWPSVCIVTGETSQGDISFYNKSPERIHALIEEIKRLRCEIQLMKDAK